MSRPALGREQAARAGIGLALGLGTVLLVRLAFGSNVRTFANGISTGALYGVLAVGIILIYRSNRIINFAAAGLGAVPGIGFVLLQVNKGLPYWIALPACLVTAAAIGAIAEFAVIRRFSSAPRLIVTVATIGVAQLLALAGFYVRDWIGEADKTDYIGPTPWAGFRVSSGGVLLLNGNQVAAVVMVAAASLGLAAFLRRTRMGIAVRASAENADRASLLGIPVKQVGTVAWAIAGAFAGLCIFVRSSLVGVPLDGSLGYSILVYALAAATVARMERIPVALLAGMGVGVLEQASTEKTGQGNLSTALMLAVVLVALALQRQKGGRALDVGSLTFQSVKEFRPVPSELRGLKEVRVVRAALAGLVAAVAIGAPYVLAESNVPKLTLVPIEAMVAISLVILTGWAGQISLGHYAIVGIAGSIAGSLAVSHDVDFFVAFVAGIAVGALVAVLIGLPALRVPGLYLAVTTLAFAAATEAWFLFPGQPVANVIVPDEFERIPRPLLWQRFDTSSPRTFYFLTLAGLALALLAARSFRKNRSGRVLIAVRDNQRAAPAYTVNLARTKLAAFAVSGGIAAGAGVLLAYQQQAIDRQPYGIGPSIAVFVTAVVGGLTSLSGAAIGAVLFKALYLFGSERLALFSTSIGLLAILLFLPGGLAEAAYRLRDDLLRRLAAKHGIHVPSLVADKRIEAAAIEHAEEAVEQAPSFDVVSRPLVRCPVCSAVLDPSDAPEHEHLRVSPPDEPRTDDLEVVAP